jgi:hypothetical protein
MGKPKNVRRHDVAKSQVEKLLVDRYLADHPRAEVKVKRQNPYSLRIRIIDPDFHGIDRATRDEKAWEILDDLADEILSEITMLVLLAPDESKSSLANLEFDHPSPSRV